MAARSPRKLFARSFVVTLAAIPACYTEQSPPPQLASKPAEPTPVVVANPPPPPVEQQPAVQPVEQTQPQAKRDRRWTITKRGNACEATSPDDCPTATAPNGPVPPCNPPPPMKVACPDGWDGKEPLTIVQYANQATCYIPAKSVKCPPDISCNPPPPREVACPTRR